MIIGLTGSFGSGKTTVAKMFAALGAKVLDADKIAHQVMKKGQKCFRPIVRLFGPDILHGGEIDRRELGKIVFKDSAKLRKLCRIIHPEVTRVIQKKARSFLKSQIIIIDAPLLIEAGLHRVVDVLIVVRANQPLQVKRVTRRMHISQQEVLRRIQHQMPIQEKLRMADIVIDNRGNLLQTKQQVQFLWTRLSQRAASRQIKGGSS